MTKSRKKTLTHNKKMIHLPPEPAEWRFWDFTQNDNDPIEEWYQDLSEDAQGVFRGLLKNNRKVKDPTQWIGFKGHLKGALKGSGIWELEFLSCNVQYRLLGVFGPGRREATLLIGCYHKQRVYTPANALETARRRKKLLEQGVATHRERKIPTDF
jgi:hypothetical protein